MNLWGGFWQDQPEEVVSRIRDWKNINAAIPDQLGSAPKDDIPLDGLELRCNAGV